MAEPRIPIRMDSASARRFHRLLGFGALRQTRVYPERYISAAIGSGVKLMVCYFLVGLEVERAKAFAGLPLFLFFYVFGQFAIYRARRYRLTRTVWWGVRFWMSGSGWSYAARSSLWAIGVIREPLGFMEPSASVGWDRFAADLRNGFAGGNALPAPHD